jgi:hypothetical protein
MRHQVHVTALLVATFFAGGSLLAQSEKQKQKKPSVSLKATPAVSFAPSRVVVTAEVRGGADDFEEFYCASIVWDWGDGTESQKTADCEPYEAGKSQIQRHFTIDHRYDLPGEYRIAFRLKKGDKVVGSASTLVRVRPGLRDIGN